MAPRVMTTMAIMETMATLLAFSRLQPSWKKVRLGLSIFSAASFSAAVGFPDLGRKIVQLVFICHALSPNTY